MLIRMVNGLLLIRGWNKFKNIINIEKIDIRLCTISNVKDIFNLQTIVIENFKENEKGYFRHYPLYYIYHPQLILFFYD